jgi:nicotinate-nucleotide pyrophosphorylase (carboxylating)
MDRSDYERIVKAALTEDLREIGDLTSDAVIPATATASADLVARQAGVVAGLDVASHVFELVDGSVEFTARVSDGDRIERGTVVASVSGPARSILTAERTALNLLSRMSGVASATAAVVEAVKGSATRISDTRKTMPGMRILDKYSVVAGGGVNHRMGLFDAVMIKDNHLVAGRSIGDAVAAARRSVGSDVEITVEAENLAQVHEILDTDADRVLLDNMDLETLAGAVELVAGRVITEASGGITLDNVAALAATGVEVISIGWVTHSAPQLDIALDFG